jgi:hypothetical protein
LIEPSQKQQTSQEYHTSVTKDMPIMYPVEGCSGSFKSKNRLQLHFCSRHQEDILVIEEEGDSPNAQHAGCSYKM